MLMLVLLVVFLLVPLLVTLRVRAAFTVPTPRRTPAARQVHRI